MAKKAAKKTSAKKSKATEAKTKKMSKKSAGKASKKTAKKSDTGKGALKYAESLQKKVVSAVKKGMTHLEASTNFEVGIHSIPKWIKKHT